MQPLTAQQRELLELLAAGLFDLDGWLADSAKYEPPEKNVPWRAQGHTFAPKDMGVIPFLEGLLRASSGDDDLSARWETLAQDPLKFSPHADPHAWRAHRGLGADPKFGVVASGNVQIADSAGRMMSRATFYAACWPSLQAAVDARAKAGPVDWAKLAQDLFTDKAAEWPTTTVPSSSAFATQFASDLLNAMLGMRNPAARPWRDALLIELGEHRRVGNHYTREDTTKAVEAFETLTGLA